MINNFIIILGAGINQLPFIYEAKKKGFKTIAFDVEKKIAADKADLFFKISIYETDKILAKLEKLNYTYKAIIARVTSSKGLLTGYKIAQKYDLIFASQTLLKLGTDKAFLSEFCEQNQIHIPKTYRLKTFEEIENLSFDESKKYIIKPAMTKVGKKNIIKFQTKKELKNIFSLTSSVSDNQEVLVQEYIEGVDIGVFAIFDKDNYEIIATLDEINGLNDNNNVMAVGLHTPSLILKNKLLMKKVDTILSLFNSLLNEQYFLAFSFRVDKNNNIFLIEIHTDLTGDLVMDKLLPTANKDFNFFSLFIDFLLKNQTNKLQLLFKDTILIYHKNILSSVDTLNILKNNYQDILDKLEYLTYIKGK